MLVWVNVRSKSSVSGDLEHTNRTERKQVSQLVMGGKAGKFGENRRRFERDHSHVFFTRILLSLNTYILVSGGSSS